MNWSNASSMAMRRARKVHDKYGVSLDGAVDIFQTIAQAGIVLAFRPLSAKFSAMLVREGDSAGIIVNSNHPLSRQRFSAAHELGHLEFGHSSTVDCGEDLIRHQAALSDSEKLAEAFASWFLMPYPLVLRVVTQLGLDKIRTAEEAYQVSLRLGTSFEATAFQLRTLKLLSPQDYQAWSKTKLSRIKRSAALDSLGDLHNDVWLIDRRDDGQSYVGRSGDCIVVTLPEIPTSGRLWKHLSERGDSIHLRDESYEAPLPGDDRVAGATINKRLTFDMAQPTALAPERLVVQKVVPWRANDVADELSVSFRVEEARSGFDPSFFVVSA